MLNEENHAKVRILLKTKKAKVIKKCPYGRDFDDELKVLEQHEPNLCKAVKNIFHDRYEYTRQYREFRKEMEKR